MLWVRLAATAAATSLIVWPVIVAAERYTRSRKQFKTVDKDNLTNSDNEVGETSSSRTESNPHPVFGDVISSSSQQQQQPVFHSLSESVDIGQLETLNDPARPAGRSDVADGRVRKTSAAVSAEPGSQSVARQPDAAGPMEASYKQPLQPSLTAAARSSSIAQTPATIVRGFDAQPSNQVVPRAPELCSNVVQTDTPAGGIAAGGLSREQHLKNSLSRAPEPIAKINGARSELATVEKTSCVVQVPAVAETAICESQQLLAEDASSENLDSEEFDSFPKYETLPKQTERELEKKDQRMSKDSILDAFAKKVAEQDTGGPESLDSVPGVQSVSSPSGSGSRRRSLDMGTIAAMRPVSTTQQLKHDFLTTLRRASNGDAKLEHEEVLVQQEEFLQLIGSPGPARVTKHGFLITETARPPTSKPAATTPISSKPRRKTSIRFEVIAGPLAGKVFCSQVVSQELKIGRNPDCDFSIPDSEVSGKHATLKWSEENSSWLLMDTGSLNGTILNGKVVSKDNRQPGEQHNLSDHDVLEFGSVTKVTVRCLECRLHEGGLDQPLHIETLHPNNSLMTTFQRGSHPGLPPVAVHNYKQFRLDMAIAQKVGMEHIRRNMPCEDVAHWECPFNPFSKVGLFCVFDGHQGTAASTAAKTVVPEALRVEFGASTGSILLGANHGSHQLALKNAFVASDQKLSMDEGCTATVVLVEEDPCGDFHLCAANVGDSEAVFVNLSRDELAVLTEDHRIAVNEREQERLRNLGHEVKTRLFGLNISRVLGDRFLKDENLGFTAEPHVSPVVKFGPKDHCVLLLASDGLWDGLTHERAKSTIDALVTEGNMSAETLVNTLMGVVLQLRLKDDVTIMVLNFLPS